MFPSHFDMGLRINGQDLCEKHGSLHFQFDVL